jgi:drug/metabolite transporter (DMT)-like permease
MTRSRLDVSRPILAALGAAVLFGGSTPFAKQLAGQLSPFFLAGLLYLGSGVGLTLLRLARDRSWHAVPWPCGEWRWFLGAIGCGGVIGPTLLMVGLARTSAASASLFLNFEAVLTAVLAWMVFKENADRRIVLGMVLIVAGGVVLSWPSSHALTETWVGPLALVGACLSWAIDNNLTRRVSAADAWFIAAVKGLVAGAANISCALALGAALPTWATASGAMLLGFFGYGVSLVLFVLALRGLGAARTGAYFSTAPFIGAAMAIVLFQESPSGMFWLAALLMGMGVWLHLTERHGHDHVHETMFHTHRHVHDAHHQDEHHDSWDGTEPHTHPHHHVALRHYHPHYPDIHHRHRHRGALQAYS